MEGRSHTCMSKMHIMLVATSESDGLAKSCGRNLASLAYFKPKPTLTSPGERSMLLSPPGSSSNNRVAKTRLDSRLQ